MPTNYNKMDEQKARQQAQSFLDETENVSLENENEIFAALDVLRREKDKTLFQSYMTKFEITDASGVYHVGGAVGFTNACIKDARSTIGTIKNADPSYIKSSQEFKDMRAAVENSEAFMQDLRNGGYIERVSEKEMFSVLDMADDLETKANAYTDYKYDALDGKKPNALESSRLAAADKARELAHTIRREMRQQFLAQANEFPIASLQSVIRPREPETVYSDRQIAEHIYLETIQRQEKNNPNFNVEKALSYDVMENAVQELMASDEFKSFSTAIVNDPSDMLPTEYGRVVYQSFREHLAKANEAKAKTPTPTPRSVSEELLSDAPDKGKKKESKGENLIDDDSEVESLIDDDPVETRKPMKKQKDLSPAPTAGGFHL